MAIIIWPFWFVAVLDAIRMNTATKICTPADIPRTERNYAENYND